MSNAICFNLQMQLIRTFIKVVLAMLLLAGISVESVAAQKLQPSPNQVGLCAPGHIQTTLSVGIADQYDPPKDAPFAAPSSTLIAALGGIPATDTDDPTIDRAFAHTFDLSNMAPNIVSAILQFEARPNPGSENDKINLIFTGSTTQGSWGSYFGAGNPNPLLPNEWQIGMYPDGHQFTLNLGVLPLSVGGSPNLIPSLNSAGYLDLYIVDDTTVDYMTLTVCSLPTPAVSIGCKTATGLGRCIGKATGGTAPYTFNWNVTGPIFSWGPQGGTIIDIACQPGAPQPVQVELTVTDAVGAVGMGNTSFSCPAPVQ